MIQFKIVCDFTYMKNFKLIFTWWNKQTFGTLLKTLFFGKLIGKDDQGNKYYKSKKDERWVVYSSSVEASKIPGEWYLWIHHTVDETPKKESQNFNWQKNVKKILQEQIKVIVPVRYLTIK